VFRATDGAKPILGIAQYAEHTLNLGSGIGAQLAERSDSKLRDKPLTQVEAIVRFLQNSHYQYL